MVLLSPQPKPTPFRAGIPKKNDYNEGRPGWAADGYADGTLRAIVEETERAFGYRKQLGIAPLLGM